MYETLDEADFRLTGTVVWHKDSYSYVERVLKKEGVIKLRLRPEGTLISINSRNLKIKGIPTGYVTDGDRPIFLSRKPTRRYRQGLRGDNTKVSPMSFRLFMNEVIEGNIKNSGEGMGWKILSQDFLDSNGSLYYRNKAVGKKIGGDYHLFNSFDFLKEELGEVLDEN